MSIKFKLSLKLSDELQLFEQHNMHKTCKSSFNFPFLKCPLVFNLSQEEVRRRVYTAGPLRGLCLRGCVRFDLPEFIQINVFTLILVRTYKKFSEDTVISANIQKFFRTYHNFSGNTKIFPTYLNFSENTILFPDIS